MVIKFRIVILLYQRTSSSGVFGDNSGIFFFLFLHKNIDFGYSL